MTHKQFEKYISKELKPCPFCGSKARLVQWRDTQSPNATWVECKKCDIHTDSHHDKCVAKAANKAIRVWNRRAK